MKQTKIVCSVSDLRCDEEFIRKLFLAGMNVVRMNTAHATPEGIKKIIRNVRAVSPHIGILIDTKGPEVRTTGTPQPIHYKTGDMVKIFGRPEMDTSKDIINVSYPDITKDVKEGDDLLLDDGAIDMKVVENTGPMLVAQVQNDGTLGSHKSVNVPGEHIDLPALTEKDKRNILLAIDEDIDFIAHSFVRSAADVKAVQDILDEHHSDIKIISKIENQEGVDNIDEIIDASYGIMIARGDLGIEVPIEKIPGIQRMIINKCIRKKKPVIVATQMLHTMIENPRPTRAEVTDIANAIYSHTDALMLSGETASGKYPVEAVETMARIAEQAEADAHSSYSEQQAVFGLFGHNPTQREFLTKAAIEATEEIGVKGIITDSATGQTARNLAAYRGPNPVLAICYKEKLQRWLNLSYGIIPVYQKNRVSTEFLFRAAVRMLRQKCFIGNDDKIAYLSGSFSHGTSFMEINTVKEVLDGDENLTLPDVTNNGK
ncbi:pyruvate kinase [Prevotella lacticifex]|uniref:Pyruvate kinase n=1 Tax=Prevotella lacticifex TaxID=2854755 RepID=A0A9R1C9P8_9BACT|nr:pyruvate kinase [Prevotella lacticifex]GJG35313.1 pyruvate kinase [Prevotella lacticifex]GJG39636.1 pyruvate kinase [Prevotella lacticifex]GJG41682.1 pyruvate kinase [Prevotella lacticifex]GJG45992.1 pyruvate kinase [Prevotella lacticifex]GJG48033.1 pyruvate kinase [Prevotella lacticifex]